MKNHTNERSLSALAALLTFALFAIGILSVLLGGANVYRRLTQRDAQSYDSRTCAQYIATKLRPAPSPGAVAIAPFGDGDSLFITETIGDSTYLTRVYCHNGWLMELFTVADSCRMQLGTVFAIDSTPIWTELINRLDSSRSKPVISRLPH